MVGSCHVYATIVYSFVKFLKTLSVCSCVEMSMYISSSWFDSNTVKNWCLTGKLKLWCVSIPRDKGLFVTFIPPWVVKFQCVSIPIDEGLSVTFIPPWVVKFLCGSIPSDEGLFVTFIPSWVVKFLCGSIPSDEGLFVTFIPPWVVKFLCGSIPSDEGLFFTVISLWVVKFLNTLSVFSCVEISMYVSYSWVAQCSGVYAWVFLAISDCFDICTIMVCL